MSLILDALKKSEAERRRGQPPSLHGSSYAPRRRSSRAPWFAGAGAVLLAAGLTGAFYYLQRPQAGAPMSADQSPAGAPGAPATAAAGTVPVPGTEAPVLSSAPEQPPGAPPTGSPEAAMLGGMDGGGTAQTVSGGGLPVPVRAGLYTPTVLPPPVVAAEPAPPAAAPAEPVAVQPVAEPAPADLAAPPTPATADVQAPPVVEAPVTAPAMAAIPPAAAPTAEQLPNMYQLPYATRKDLPKLTLSMHVYSPLREERFIVLNGKRYTLDNAQPGPDLNLLDIVADGAVMEFRGQRFLLPRQTY
ncbi:MAG: general secretion pathway protein GspB [Lysobacterales bacterium]